MIPLNPLLQLLLSHTSSASNSTASFAASRNFALHQHQFFRTTTQRQSKAQAAPFSLAFHQRFRSREIITQQSSFVIIRKKRDLVLMIIGFYSSQPSFGAALKHNGLSRALAAHFSLAAFGWWRHLARARAVEQSLNNLSASHSEFTFQ